MDTLLMKTADEVVSDNARINSDEWAAQRLAEATIVMRIDLSFPGQSRKADASRIQTDADREMLTVTKRLYDGCKEFRRVHSAMLSAKRWMQSRAVPSNALKGGYERIPVKLVEEVEQGLQARWNDLQPLIDDFVAAYPEIVAQAQKRLGSLSTAADFPPVEDIRGEFGLRWWYLSMDVPNSLSEINGALFQRERAKMKEQIKEELRAVRLGLREGMAGLVEHMVERLTPGSDGKPKTFRNTLITNMREFLDLFDARNVADDRELQAIVAKARAILSGGVDAETLRNYDGVRERVRDAFEGMKAQLGGMVVAATRKLDLTGDDE